MKNLILVAAAVFGFAGAALADDGAFYTGAVSAGDPVSVVAHFNQDGDTWRPLAPNASTLRISSTSEDLAALAAKTLDNDARGFN